MTPPRPHRRERGQAVVEVLGMLLPLLVAGMAALQLLAIGSTLSAAANAARSGSRARALGLDPTAAAVSSLPLSRRDAATVTLGPGTRVTVRVGVPLVLPGVPVELVTVSRSAELPEA